MKASFKEGASDVQVAETQSLLRNGLFIVHLSRRISSSKHRNSEKVFCVSGQCLECCACVIHYASILCREVISCILMRNMQPGDRDFGTGSILVSVVVRVLLTNHV